jgi:hypothetical protein
MALRRKNRGWKEVGRKKKRIRRKKKVEVWRWAA